MTMSIEEAREIIGGQPMWAIRNMVTALEMMPWLNTELDKQRLQAARIVLAAARRKRPG